MGERTSDVARKALNGPHVDVIDGEEVRSSKTTTAEFLDEPDGGDLADHPDNLTAAEQAWSRALVQRGWQELGWHVVGRDAAGHLVAVTVLPCGTSDSKHQRHCYQTLTPAGLVYRSVTVVSADPKERPA
jgi:hypothetical protein